MHPEFIGTLLTLGKTWKQPTCPQTGEEIGTYLAVQLLRLWTPSTGVTSSTGLKLPIQGAQNGELRSQMLQSNAKNRGEKLMDKEEMVYIYTYILVDTGVGNLSLLQGIFPTQGSNPGLLHAGRFFNSWDTKEAHTHTHTHTHTGIVAIEKNEIMLFVATWMDLEIVILSEVKVRQRKTNTIQCWQAMVPGVTKKSDTT